MGKTECSEWRTEFLNFLNAQSIDEKQGLANGICTDQIKRSVLMQKWNLFPLLPTPPGRCPSQFDVPTTTATTATPAGPRAGAEFAVAKPNTSSCRQSGSHPIPIAPCPARIPSPSDHCLWLTPECCRNVTTRTPKQAAGKRKL